MGVPKFPVNPPTLLRQPPSKSSGYPNTLPIAWAHMAPPTFWLKPRFMVTSTVSHFGELPPWCGQGLGDERAGSSIIGETSLVPPHLRPWLSSFQGGLTGSRLESQQHLEGKILPRSNLLQQTQPRRPWLTFSTSRPRNGADAVGSAQCRGLTFSVLFSLPK